MQRNRLFNCNGKINKQQAILAILKRDPNYIPDLTCIEAAKNASKTLTILTPDPHRKNQINIFKRIRCTDDDTDMVYTYYEEVNRYLLVRPDGEIELYDHDKKVKVDEDINKYFFNISAIELYDKICNERFYQKSQHRYGEFLSFRYEGKNINDVFLSGEYKNLQDPIYFLNIEKDGNIFYSISYKFKDNFRMGPLGRYTFNSIDEVPDQGIKDFHEKFIKPLLYAPKLSLKK